jgi:hypothetical protein
MGKLLEEFSEIIFSRADLACQRPRADIGSLGDFSKSHERANGLKGGFREHGG